MKFIVQRLLIFLYGAGTLHGALYLVYLFESIFLDMCMIFISVIAIIIMMLSFLHEPNKYYCETCGGLEDES